MNYVGTTTKQVSSPLGTGSWESSSGDANPREGCWASQAGVRLRMRAPIGNKYRGGGPGGGFGICGPNMPNLARSRRWGDGGDRGVFQHSLI